MRKICVVYRKLRRAAPAEKGILRPMIITTRRPALRPGRFSN
jgi:hypothetical protein